MNNMISSGKDEDLQIFKKKSRKNCGSRPIIKQNRKRMTRLQNKDYQNRLTKRFKDNLNDQRREKLFLNGFVMKKLNMIQQAVQGFNAKQRILLLQKCEQKIINNAGIDFWDDDDENFIQCMRIITNIKEIQKLSAEIYKPFNSKKSIASNTGIFILNEKKDFEQIHDDFSRMDQYIKEVPQKIQNEKEKQKQTRIEIDEQKKNVKRYIIKLFKDITQDTAQVLSKWIKMKNTAIKIAFEIDQQEIIENKNKNKTPKKGSYEYDSDYDQNEALRRAAKFQQIEEEEEEEEEEFFMNNNSFLNNEIKKLRMKCNTIQMKYDELKVENDKLKIENHKFNIFQQKQEKLNNYFENQLADLMKQCQNEVNSSKLNEITTNNKSSLSFPLKIYNNNITKNNNSSLLSNNFLPLSSSINSLSISNAYLNDNHNIKTESTPNSFQNNYNNNFPVLPIINIKTEPKLNTFPIDNNHLSFIPQCNVNNNNNDNSSLLPSIESKPLSSFWLEDNISTPLSSSSMSIKTEQHKMKNKKKRAFNQIENNDNNIIKINKKRKKVKF